MIKNVIFDLENVLTNFDPMPYVSSKVSDKEKCRNVYEEIFKSKEWTMLDRMSNAGGRSFSKIE